MGGTWLSMGSQFPPFNPPSRWVNASSPKSVFELFPKWKQLPAALVPIRYFLVSWGQRFREGSLDGLRVGPKGISLKIHKMNDNIKTQIKRLKQSHTHKNE